MNERSTLIRSKWLINLCKGRLGHILNITTISGCRNLVPASPHTALGETSVRATWIDAKGESSVGIAWLLNPEPGSGPIKPTNGSIVGEAMAVEGTAP